MVEITLVIISAVIGAGFATGAELVAFFGGSALPAWATAILVAVFTMVFMSILIFCKKRQTRVTRAIFTTTYVLIFIVMAAGLRAIAGLPTMLVSLVFCCLIVFWGMGGLLRVNKYMMYFVLAILLIVCFGNLGGSGTIEVKTSVGQSVFNCLIYAGLNCCILERTLSQLQTAHSRKRVVIACGLAVAVIGALVCLILTTFACTGVSAEMPILELSNNIITKSAVFFCILTSMMICLFNISTRLPLCVFVCGLAFGFSFFGFGSLLGGVYRLIGVFMVLYCCGLGLFHLFRRNRFVVDNAVDCLQIVQDK